MLGSREGCFSMDLHPLWKVETLKKWLRDIFENGSGGVFQKSLKREYFFKLFWKTPPDPFSKLSPNHFFKVSPFNKGRKLLGLQGFWCKAIQRPPWPRPFTLNFGDWPLRGKCKVFCRWHSKYVSTQSVRPGYGLASLMKRWNFEKMVPWQFWKWVWGCFSK